MFARIFSWLETRTDSFPAEQAGMPPATFWGFILYYTRPFWPMIIASSVFAAAVALIEVSLFGFLGDLVDWLSKADRNTFWSDYGSLLIGMSLVVLVLLPILKFFYEAVVHQGLLGVRAVLDCRLLGHLDGLLARGGHVAAKQRWQLGPQCHPGRACQRGQVDHQRRLAFTGIRQRITQNDPALGVGVADFDVQALAGLEHISRPIGVTRDGVLDHGQQHLQAYRQLERHHQRGEPECVSRTTHVFFHLAHALSALDVQATTVETHSLADQAEQGITRLAPGQLDQARGPGAGAPDSVDGGKVLLQQRLTHHAPAPTAQAG